jgi:DnaJ-class molecular chaperone
MDETCGAGPLPLPEPCVKCDGDGTLVYDPGWYMASGRCGGIGPCDECGGLGYIVRQVNQ